MKLPLWGEILLGAALACIPFLFSIAMSPEHRSPYLLSYPSVILSAWLLGLPGAVTCAVVSGLAIEYFIFMTHRINLAPTPDGWFFRGMLFVCGSILVGTLTRAAAREKEVALYEKHEKEMLFSRIERDLADERVRASELAMENEVRLQMALDGANAGVWEWDMTSNTEVWSSGFYRLHLLDPASSPDNDLWRSSVYPEDLEQVERDMETAIQTKGNFLCEYRVPLPDGGMRWIACQGVCRLNGAGEVTGLRGYCGDVTRRKLTDQALLRNEKLAIAGRLSATIAHEINNPLNAALTLLFLLKDGTLNAEQASYVEETEQQLERIVEITRQTLQMSRSTQKFVPVKPVELVKGTLRLLTPKLNLSHVVATLDEESQGEILGSPGELQQVLTNLINNSIEAMPQGGRLRVRVRASCHWRSRTQQGIRITLADSGAGMPPEVYRHIMEPFFTTKEDTGTGLGMWVVSELLTKHEATLTIRSSTQPAWHGTTTSIFLPLATSQAGAPRAA